MYIWNIKKIFLVVNVVKICICISFFYSCINNYLLKEDIKSF